jgi:SPX domain protein involved in polyphosphate accumulation
VIFNFSDLEMLSAKEQLEPLRYERKYLINDYSYGDVKQFIKFHPASFSEIYHERRINNIYFDTPGMSNYYDNEDGSTDRKKVRIRWYGDLFGKIDSPILEYKIKNGLLGYKVSHKLPGFTIGQPFIAGQLKEIFKSASIPDNVKDELLFLQPTLLNQYKRKYFLSADKKFRITIDHDLTYYGISVQTFFINRSVDYTSTVLELKYDLEHETEVNQVSSMFPFMLTKNSKYLSGLQRVFF